MSSIDQQFVEFIVKSLVGNPDAVHIERRIDEKGVLLELTVDPEDLGRVIGKRGATAQSLRTLLRALGTKNDARYNLKIVDNGVEAESYADAAQTPGAPTSANDASDASQGFAAHDQHDSQTADQPDDTSAAQNAPAELGQSDPAEQQENVVSKTRKELEELDDLDV